ncbi:MAG: NUDIX hydrolase, partial [Deltaproteobacteria bacterium]
MAEIATQLPVVAVRIIVMDRNGCILLLKRANSKYGEGQWCLPGGKLDYGDTPECTVEKELSEETSLVSNNIEFLFYQNSLPIQPGKMHCVNLYFRCTATGDVRLNEENSEFVWVTPEDVGQYQPVFGAQAA